MADKHLPDDMTGIVKWLRARAEGHAPGYDLAIYGRPHALNALANHIEKLQAAIQDERERAAQIAAAHDAEPYARSIYQGVEIAAKIRA